MRRDGQPALTCRSDEIDQIRGINSNVRDRLLWVSVTLKAEADMFLEADRLRFGRLGAPVLDKRVLKVKAGETFTIHTRSSEGFRVGDRLPLDRVAHKLPISLKWRTIATA